MSDHKIKIGITQGDTNGIGYEVILKALEDPRMTEMCTPVIYGSAKIANFYRKAASLPQIPLNQIQEVSQAKPGQVNIINVVDESVKVEPGVASSEAGRAAFMALEAAVTDLRAGKISALVTAPINKSTIQSGEFSFPGHTEYLEASLAENGEKALMILASENVRVALVTIHTPIASVAPAITAERVEEKIKAFNNALEQDFGLSHPRIAVLSLNPHAGEDGLLGSEEKEHIAPAIKNARDRKINCFGPYASDGFFGSGMWRKFDGVLAMYHDQGLAPFKTLAMDAGVNITSGLPFVRTSPDHGTGFDIAGKGVASPESMRCAIYEAIDICRARQNHAEAHRNPLKKQYVERNKKDNVVLDLSKSSDEA
ncbi:MAG: 4-hydroxythreonine-4-phosphate dehydrogenase PdxA [Firmicutes bacterium]|nr:4-hydroxythreonine-4-phosphate dehydrogenase PdxA [Bacillota bacterium]MCM1400557.1 4-hydroxythreonine-4-phosphate dehydrogenase PdxA [Bacteroides sp.]MCM1476461.1 4-hydroxythreonine-4-phosphate dehydrogenase PdxA [Bacteroides sp.]